MGYAFCRWVVLLLVVCPGLAAAEGERADFWWSPSLRVSTVIDDNVFFEDGEGEGSAGFWLAPRVEAGYRGAALEVGTDVGVDVRRYLDGGSQLSDEFYRVLGWAELGIAPGWSLRVADAYVPQPAVLGFPDDDGQNLVQTNRADAELRWWRELAGGQATLTAGIVGTHFLTGKYTEWAPVSGGFVLDPSVEADYFQGLGFAQIEVPLGERTAIWGRWQASYRDFDALPAADHANFSMFAGVRSGRWRGVEIELSGAAGAIAFERLGTELRALARARVLRRFESGFSVWASGGFSHSPDLSGDELEEAVAEIGLEQLFGSATAVSLRIDWTRVDGGFQVGGVNVFGAAELQLRRQLTRRLQVGLRYRHWRNVGAFTADDFSQNRINIEFGLRL